MRGSKHKEVSSGLLYELLVAFKQSMIAVMSYLSPFVDRVIMQTGIYDRG